jgi:acyl dehydratase
VPVITLDEIRSRVGQEIGVSGWLTMNQERIDEFADSTEDRQFIHVDPQAAAQTPFGTTIAHGFLSLSMLSRMAAEVMLIPDTTRMALSSAADRTGSRSIGPPYVLSPVPRSVGRPGLGQWRDSRLNHGCRSAG